MELQQKIYENLRGQMIVGIKADKLHAQMKELDGERERFVGGIAVLSDLYKDETGNDLQKVINTDPEWGKLVEQAQNEAQQIVVQQLQGSAQPQVGQPEAPAADVSKPMPKLRRVAGNKTVKAEDAQEEPPPRQVPMDIVIDDNPPGPGTPDKPDPS